MIQHLTLREEGEPAQSFSAIERLRRRPHPRAFALAVAFLIIWASMITVSSYYTPHDPTKYDITEAPNTSTNNGNTDLIIRAQSASPAHLLNISTRTHVETGDNVLIGGFIITGKGTKRVVVRGIGPSLATVGVPGALADPVLELHKPGGAVITNDNWYTQRINVSTTGIAPTSAL